MEFNDYANPTIDTERLKIYCDVSTTGSSQWELQGRGVASNTLTTNSDVTNDLDVLGLVDINTGKAKPTMDIELKLRKGSVLGEKIFESWIDRSCVVKNLNLLLKYEFVNVGEGKDNCLACKETGCAISLSNVTAEAGGKITVSGTLYLTNETVKGYMPIIDGETITWTEGVPA